jgi:hypothetical protein
MRSIEDDYQFLMDEISLGSISEELPKIESFFNTYANLAAANGDCPDLTYCPILNSTGYRVDGYAFDIPEEAEGASGDLYIAICNFVQNDKVPILNSKDIVKSTEEVEKFLKLTMNNSSIDIFDESSNEYQLAMLIREHLSKIARIRILLFTNGVLKTRKKVFETRDILNLVIHTNVLDFERYSKISSSGNDPVEINFDEDFQGGIPCLQASSSDSGYKSYLFAIPASILANIFATYGNRLLEQNVRTYLQAKTSVNKGILKTILNEPSMFFAYNNGLTATASIVKTIKNNNGIEYINYIKDFQIVNGGQTTASILYARDGLKYDLSNVFAQVKLSEVDETKLDSIVPKISEYANTQNKVSLADLASNSPVQIKIERLSKEVVVPQKAGALYSSKWFYERARGQYKNLFTYTKSGSSQRKKIEAEFPKSQYVEKTDLAKFELSFEGRPHHVSEGAQSCFKRYIGTVLKPDTDPNDINETWFKSAIAKGILFRTIDKNIASSEWYKSDKGLKAQTVTYTVAACAQAFRDLGFQIDLLRIWKEQEVPIQLLDWILVQAHQVHKILNSPPGIVKNPSEFCKKEFCWTQYVRGKIEKPDGRILDYGLTILDFTDEIKGGKKTQRKNEDLDFEIKLAKLMPDAMKIRADAEKKRLISENNSSALNKLAAGKFNFSKSEINALKNLFLKLEIDLKF